MFEKNVRLNFTNVNLQFPVVDYDIGQYTLKVYIQKGDYDLDSIKDLLFNLMRFSAVLEDLDALNEINTLPCFWESQQMSLDEIEELTNSFLLTFNATIFKTKEIQKNTADIDYLAMMMDLELE